MSEDNHQPGMGGEGPPSPSAEEGRGEGHGAGPGGPASPGTPEPADDPRIVELTAQLEASATQLAQLTGALEQEQKATGALKAALSSAAVAYRTAALANLPEVPPELVGGETVEDVQASIQRAKDLVDAVKARLPVPAASPAPLIPAGAPARTEPDLSALSPADKIRYALSTERR